MSLLTDSRLEEIRERRTLAEAEWGPILEEARKDRLCIAGKPWDAMDPKGLKKRQETNRPAIALDELGQYINQTVNGVRANPRGIRFAPTGNGANDAGAEFYQNHVREIEYRSTAKVAYSTPFQQMIESSIGWLRVKTARVHPRTFSQDLWIEPIFNADQVLPSPFVWPDARDLKHLYYIEPWPEGEFLRHFPKAEVRSFTSEWRTVATAWLQPKIVQVAEYWALDPVIRRLVAFQDPATGQIVEALIDELPGGKLPDGVENLREEQVDDTEVYSCLTNGIEILKVNTWLGKHIPFVACTGKVLYAQGTEAPRQIASMTRLARDPYMLYCYVRTCEAEAIGGVPRTQWVGYKGQFADPDRWEQANHQPVAFTEVLEQTERTPPGTVLPLPQRQPWDPPLGNLEMMAEAARRAIQAAMGITPLPTDMQRQNQKLSGRAVDRLRSSEQQGSFHFVDHYELMVERTGVILEDLIDKVLDTARDVPVRKPDETAAIVRVNDPSTPDAITTKGSYRVTISTGPATDSQRDEASDFVDAMVSNLAVIAQMAGPMVAMQVLAKSIKLKQLGPIGEEIVDLLSPMKPGEDGKPIPPEVQKLLGENQQLKQMLQQAAQEKEAKQVEIQGKGQIEHMRQTHEDARSRESNDVKLQIAQMQATLERLALALESQQQMREQAHEIGMARMAHGQAMEAGREGVVGQMAVQATRP